MISLAIKVAISIGVFILVAAIYFAYDYCCSSSAAEADSAEIAATLNAMERGRAAKRGPQNEPQGKRELVNIPVGRSDRE